MSSGGKFRLAFPGPGRYDKRRCRNAAFAGGVSLQKQVLAIHDLSCVGRCSLTVALPVLSAAGLHVSALPTALLSTHTGEFTGYTYLDLTQEMARIYAHFQTLPLRFDGLYSGFLGCWEQLALVEDVFARYRRADTLLMVDPVMADHGRLYATYTDALAKDMGRLCHRADVIVPNLTEAAILLEESYQARPSFPQVEAMLRALHRRYGCRQAVITGIAQGGLLGAAAYDAARDQVYFHGQPPLEQVFYGTGDVLASALLAALMRGQPLDRAAALAVDFTYESMLHTLDNGLPLRYGVAFEQAIPTLVRALENGEGSPRTN